MSAIENGILSRRSLNILLFLFFAVLAGILVTSDRGVSGVMERIGGFVTYLFGQ